MEYVYHPKGFVNYHSGSRADPKNVSPVAHSKQRGMAPQHEDPRAPTHWNSSSKVRNPEAVHYPEYKNWHLGGPKVVPKNNEAYNWKFQAPPGYEVPTKVSRGPKLRVNENCGFAWDPKAAYGPETIQAMPGVDDKYKEALFDESADQARDGIPGTGFEHFGAKGMNTAASAKSQHAALPPRPKPF